MNKRLTQQAVEVVGTAWRCRDGLVRWFHHVSERGLLHIRWLDEPSGVWHDGGTVRGDRWQSTGTVEQVAAPVAGDCYSLSGATGIVSKYVVEAAA